MIFTRRTILVLFLSLVFALGLLAQIPDGYYSSTEGKTGAELKTALYDIIKNHTVISYNDLWAAFQYTDKKSNGKVWDMYSDKPGQTPPYEYTFVTNQCGTYNSEGDCYNREHSFPKSWFNDASPMYSDLFHLYPTDGYVNNRRSNYIFAEVSTVSWTSLNGSKLGTSTASGSTLTVFEPIDEYKGDFARTYFYMATRYENLIPTWATYNTEAKAILDGTSYPAYKQWYINLLLKWHQQDPVSQKEIDRNNVIYTNYQHNRNPFIDHPEYAQLIWGTSTPISFTSTPVTTATVGVGYTYTITASGGNGSFITISAVSHPAWLTLTQTGNGTATLSGTPSQANVGNHSVSLKASDGMNETIQSFTINVSIAQNVKPSISDVTVTPASPVTRQTITVSANISDTDGSVSKAIFSWGYSSANLSNSYEMQADQSVYSAPVPAQTNPTSIFFRISAIDNASDTSYYNSSFSVGQNQLPAISNIAHSPISPTSTDAVNVTANVSDPEGRLGNVFLLWGITEASQSNQIQMMNGSGAYSATIPANPSQTTVYYRIKAYDAEGQSVLSSLSSYLVTPATAIPNEALKQVSVYPNPFSNFIQVDYPLSDNYTLTLSNLIGQVVYSKAVINGNTRIDCSELQPGIYMLTLKGNNGTIIRKMLKR